MRIYVYPADVHGCGFLRLIWPARALAAQGHHITIVMPGDPRTAMFMPNGFQNEQGRTVGATAPRDADVMVLQRVTHRGLAEAIPLFRSKGIAVVVDMDDDLTCIHPANPAWAAYNLNPNGAFTGNAAQDACRDATLVTTSTPALAERYAPHGRSVVLYNCIPERYLSIPHEDSDVVGWAGSVATHPDDLDVVGPAVVQHTLAGGSFRIVGPPQGVSEKLGLEDVPWSASGGVPIAGWAQQISDDIGIGLAPLSDTKFNSAKSWLKPLEYASLGVPPIMSPRAEYQRIHDLGVGRLAKRPRDWYRLMKELRQDAALRQDLSAQGREIAAEWTIEGNAWRWMEAWDLARKTQNLVRAS